MYLCMALGHAVLGLVLVAFLLLAANFGLSVSLLYPVLIPLGLNFFLLEGRLLVVF